MNDFASETLTSRQKLVADLQRVITDAEELLQVTAHQTGDKVVELRARIAENLRQARYKLVDAEAAIKDKAQQACRATDDYVHEHPWLAIGTAASLGLVLGLLLGGRR